MTGQGQIDSAVWRPQSMFATSIASARQLQVFNDKGGIAVNFDVLRSAVPNIIVSGSQNKTFSLWETRSTSGFVTKPKFSADLVTIRFVTSGSIIYRHRTSNALGLPTHATLIGFEDLREVQTSSAFSAISATIAIDVLVAAHKALTGDDHRGLPPLAPVAELNTPGMKALFCTVRQIQHQISETDRHNDFLLPLIQEVMSYQLLSAWPLRAKTDAPDSKNISSKSLRIALDYIDANLCFPITLSDIAIASNTSVRSLQNKFRQELGKTPVQFIIDRRLLGAHQDLISSHNAALSVNQIARRWGFVHMSDFGQRYRRSYGCTPSETRLKIAGKQ